MEQATAHAASVNIVTEVPGPRSRDLAQRSAAALADALSLVYPIYVDHAHGATVTDIDGNTFIDWIGGVGVLNVGHTHPSVTEAIIAQAQRFTHTDYTIVPYETYVRLCERLNESAPIDGPKKSALFNTGAETVENAVKISRAATGRSGVICFAGAFHGRSLMAMTMTSKVHPYRAGFGPYAPEVYRAPFANPLDFNGDEEAASEYALTQLRKMTKTHFAAEHIACMVVEPVQGEAGFVVPPASFLRGLREFCDEHGIVLVFDEVQSGMGRTGKLWATEHFDVRPDLLLSAKSIAAGVPLGAIIGKAEIMDRVPDSGIGGTYPGNPLACEAAHAVLDAFEGGLLDRAVIVGETLKTAFDALQAEDAGIAESRGLGPMRALEFMQPGTKTPDSDRVDAIQAYAAQHGLLMHKAGVGGNCIRVLVPLVITDAQLEESLGILRAAITATR
ncbi:MAG: 4-aminobutyrate aminotransferase apoenzyme [Thermoleophilia bacterium]|nr:4-aminobutyrate aminotransferase apoenzyme [Thermoleophilia bacterium]MCZ4496844.1 4-aminobutyrate aminotransferase apoenzyme [Thermoleophilia bacterium]